MEKSMGPVEAVREAFKEVAPGLSLGKILSDVGNELKEMGKQGAHELAAALFSPSGSAFVMYPRAGQEQEAKQPDHGIQPEIEQERGGR